MPNNDFFTEEQQTIEPTVEKIAVGGKEYTQDELTQLVGLGEIGRELESKWGTKIDRVYPEFTKKSQELNETRAKLTEFEQRQIETKVNTGVELSPEEQRRQALQQAEGLGLVTQQNVVKFINDYMEGQRILSTVNEVIKDADSKGIKTDADTILNHMQQEGFKNPQKAFKDLYEEPLKAWETKQLSALKPEPIVSEGFSTAGGKQPTESRPNRDNLKELISQALGGE